MARSREEIEDLARIAAERFTADLLATAAGGGDTKVVLARHSSMNEELLSTWSSEERIIFHDRYSDDIVRLAENPDSIPTQQDGYLYLLPGKRESKIDRAAIREYVRRDGEALLAAARNGLNIHQRALDQKDIVDAYAASLNQTEADELRRIYAEEVAAMMTHVNSVPPASHVAATPQATENQSMGMVGGVIAFVCVIIVLLALLKR